MIRVSDTIRRCNFIILDSTMTLDMFICSLHDKNIGGKARLIYVCKTRDDKQLPDFIVGSGIDYEPELDEQMKACPWYYATYANWDENVERNAMIGMTDATQSEIHKELNGIINKLENNPDSSPGKYLVLSKLYARVNASDSLRFVNLRKAAARVVYDDAFDDDFFWQRFHLTQDKARILTPLAVNFPKTILAQAWLKVESKDDGADTGAFGKVAGAWEKSHDTRILRMIGEAYDFLEPLRNCSASLYWLDKAEQSIRTRAGFYSGDDVNDCQPENILPIMLDKVNALANAGFADSAIGVAKSALATATLKNDKIRFEKSLEFLYIQAGDTANARRCVDIINTLDSSGNSMNFAYTTVDGKHGFLSDFRGKVIFLDFWYIGCPGCELEKKSISDLADSFMDNDLVAFLTIAMNDTDALKKYLSTVAYHLPVVSDPKGDLSKQFDIKAYPTHIILGKDGTVMNRSEGGSENIGSMLRPEIEAALAEKEK